MRFSTADRYVSELIVLTDYVYSGAVAHHLTMHQLSEEYCQRILQDSRWSRLPGWAKSKLRDYKEFKRKVMVDKYIRMFYIGLDGRKIPTHKSWDLFTEEERQHNDLTLHHLWMSERVQLGDDGSRIYTYTPTDDLYYCSKIEK